MNHFGPWKLIFPVWTSRTPRTHLSHHLRFQVCTIIHYEIPQEKIKESMLQTSARMCSFHNAAYDGIVLPPVLSWKNTFRFIQYNRFKSFVNTNGHFFLSPCVPPCSFRLCWMLKKNKNKIKAFAAVALQWAESRLKAFPKPLCWYNWSGSSRVHRVPAFKQARCIASTCKFLLYFFTFFFLELSSCFTAYRAEF